MLRVFLVIDDYNELMYLQTLLKKLGFDVEGLQNSKKYADLSLGFNPQVLIMTARGRMVDGISLGKSIKKRNGYPKIIALKSRDVGLTSEQVEEAGIDLVVDTPINPKHLILALANLGSIDENTLFDKFSRMKANNSANDSAIHQKYDENGQPIQDLKKVKKDLDMLMNLEGESQKGIEEHSQEDAISNNQSEAPIFSLEEERKPTMASPALVEEGNDLAAQSGKRVTPDFDPKRQARIAQCKSEIGQLPKQSFNRERILEFNKKIRQAAPAEDIDQIEGERKAFVRSLFVKKS